MRDLAGRFVRNAWSRKNACRVTPASSGARGTRRPEGEGSSQRPVPFVDHSAQNTASEKLGATMPDAKTTAAVTSIRAAYELTKAMIGVRDNDLLAQQARELNNMLLDVLDKSIAAREAQAAQLDHLAELKAEIASLKAWGSD